MNSYMLSFTAGQYIRVKGDQFHSFDGKSQKFL